MPYSLDAGFRDAVLAPQLFSARLASLLRQDAPVALLIGASEQRRLRESGLLGPTPRGARFLCLMRRVSFALASGEWSFRGANLGSLAFGPPNADFACWIWRN